MVTKIKDLMFLKHNIRNVCVIGHVRHGKTTLVRSLISSGKLLGQATEKIATMEEYETELCHSIKATVASTSHVLSEKMQSCYQGERQGNTFLVNLIDSPGHADFGAEVSSSLRVTDGALIIVDCLEGVTMQTERFIRLALCERCTLILVINKMDKLVDELNVSGEEAYVICNKIVQKINSIITVCQDPVLGDARVYPQKGTVGFCSSSQGWAFTLLNFAEAKTSSGSEREELMSRLWGENWYDPKTRKWTEENNGSTSCRRGFVGYCYNPIREVIHYCRENEKTLLWKKLAAYEIYMKPAEKDLNGEALMNRVMKTWLPCGQLLDTIVLYLPSPVSAQHYRVDTLYEGPSDDSYANAIRNCNEDGSLMIYVSKTMPSSDYKRVFAFGRIFSGEVKTGLKVNVMGPNFIPGHVVDLSVHNITEVIVWIGENQGTMEKVPCGNLVALLGIDKAKFKNYTLTNSEKVNAYQFRKMKLSISPVMCVSIQCHNATDVEKFNSAVDRLDISDQGVVCTNDKKGKKLIAGSGVIHLQHCIRILEDHYLDGTSIRKTDPVVCYRETVFGSSSQTVMGISPNKKNLIQMEAWQLDKHLVEAIEDGQISERSSDRNLITLVEDFYWDIKLAKNILCFEPGRTGPNILVDIGLEYPNNVKKYIVDAFKKALTQGPLLGERMTGICFKVCGVKFDVEPNQRGKQEINEAVKRAIYAAHLSAKPRIMEPIYALEIQVKCKKYYNAMDVVKQRKGREIEGTECLESCSSKRKAPCSKIKAPCSKIKALLPVNESFDLPNKLRASTSGEASLQAEFHHWDVIESDPLDKDSPVAIHLELIQKRKGLIEKMKMLSEYQE